MMPLSYLQKSVMKSWLIARTRTSAKERLNLFDRFLEAATSRGMDMSGLICGYLPPFLLVTTTLTNTHLSSNTSYRLALKDWSKRAKHILLMARR